MMMNENKNQKECKMSFKQKINGQWYNGNGEKIENPKAYACAIFGRPYKQMWEDTPNTCVAYSCTCGCSNNDNDYNDDYEPPMGPTADEEAQSHGYANYNDYCDEYMEGHTGGELGEPCYPDIDDSYDDCDW